MEKALKSSAGGHSVGGGGGGVEGYCGSSCWVGSDSSAIERGREDSCSLESCLVSRDAMLDA